MSESKWTKELPTKTGWYWHRRDASDHFPEVFRVSNIAAFETSFYRFGQGGHWPIKEVGGEWCRIEPPKS